jgi:anti-sigma factor RsiW
MTCRELLDFLDDWVSGDLPRDVRGRFDGHLGGCAECVAYLGSYEDTIRLGKAAFGPPDDPVPADVPEGLVRAILAARDRHR